MCGSRPRSTCYAHAVPRAATRAPFPVHRGSGSRRLPALPAGVPVGLLAAAALLGSGSSAHAYEDRGTVGAELGYGVVVIPDTDLPQHGLVAGVEGSIGLWDVLVARVHAAYAFHPGDDPLHVVLFGAELLYLVDIVQVVPFFGLGIDGLTTVWQDEVALELGLHVTVGAEYLVSRNVAIGIDVRPHFLPVTLTEGRLEPVYITVGARISYLFDF